MNKAKIGYLSIDIENGGSEHCRPLLAIGIALGDGVSAKVERRTFCAAKLPVSATYEPRCWEEFWKKNMDVHNRIMKDGKDVSTAAMTRDFAAFLDDLEGRFERITVLSDNPAFDLAHVDVRLDKYCDRGPIRYTSDGKYRFVTDPSERMAMIPKVHRKAIQAAIDKIVPHDHWPENDAYNIYLQYVATEKYRAAQEELEDKAEQYRKDHADEKTRDSAKAATVAQTITAGVVVHLASAAIVVASTPPPVPAEDILAIATVSV